jgi:hypothetical protein
MTFRMDLLQLVSGSALWLLVCWIVLTATGSALPRQLRARLRLQEERVPSAI